MQLNPYPQAPETMLASPPPRHPTPTLPAPLESREIREAMIKPHLSVEVLLSDPYRLVATLPERSATLWLALLTACASVLCAVPFGLVLGLERFWQVAVLFFGSQLICLPSLHVFSLFVGCRVSLAQSFVFGTMVSAVAALFSLGFAPIAWFLSATMPADGSALAGHYINLLLLTASLGAGLVHLGRCLAAGYRRRIGPHPWVLAGWTVLLLFITYRMAGTLGLLV